MLAVGISFSLTAKSAADSTLLYTLKENERIVMVTEHRLLVSNTNIGHLLFLSRPSGYFVLYNNREFGPFETLAFSESQVSLMDWAVKQKGKWYQLLLDKGQMIGPYDETVDIYRSTEFYEAYKGTDYTGEHYGFRARSGNNWYTIIDGKPYGPYKKEPAMGIPHFWNSNGILVASLVDYEYDWRTNRSKSEGDSLVLGKALATQYYVLNNTLFKGEQKLMDKMTYVGEDISRKNYLAIDTAGLVYLNGTVLADCPKAFREGYGKYYNSEKPDFIFDTGHALIRLDKKEGSDENYYYNTKLKKKIGPIETINLGSLSVTRDANHYAYATGTRIIVDDKVVHRKGFSLVHNPAKDCFSWLTVKDRSIYLHNLKP